MPFSAQSLQVTWQAPEDRVCDAPGRSDLYSGHFGTHCSPSDTATARVRLNTPDPHIFLRERNPVRVLQL